MGDIVHTRRPRTFQMIVNGQARNDFHSTPFGS